MLQSLVRFPMIPMHSLVIQSENQTNQLACYTALNPDHCLLPVSQASSADPTMHPACAHTLCHCVLDSILCLTTSHNPGVSVHKS